MANTLKHTSARSVIFPVTAVLIGLVSFTAFSASIAVVSCLLGWAMLVIATEDAKHFIIPDSICLPLIPAGLIVTGVLSAPQIADRAILDHLTAALLAGAALFAVRYGYQKYRGFEGLGLGDVKLAATAGAWTGLGSIGHVLLIACVAAIIFVGLMALRRHTDLKRTTAVPFGTFLAPSIWLVWAIQHI